MAFRVGLVRPCRYTLALLETHQGYRSLVSCRSRSLGFQSRGLSQSSHIPAQVHQKAPRVLRDVPLPLLFRSLLVLSVAALPSSILSVIIRTTKRHSQLLSNSRLLRWPVQKTFYNTFCIGSENAEIRENIKSLRGMGLDGIVLAFARETKIGDQEQTNVLTETNANLREWVSMNMETLQNLTDEDYLALRCTGAGPAAVAALDAFSASTPGTKEYEANLETLRVFEDALTRICAEAEKKGVRILIDAESSLHQAAIDYVALSLMFKFNQNGRAVIYNTYQMYLQAGTSKMIKHIRLSQDQNFTIGIKMVRGAYLHVEARPEALHKCKQDTDDCYDNSVRFLFGGKVDSSESGSTVGQTRPWNAEIMLATHNDASVQKALSLWRSGGALTDTPNANGGTVQSLSFAQLMGMADEVSLGLVADKKDHTWTSDSVPKESLPTVGVYKYTIWGSFEECLLYMLRRAEENQDAVARTRGTALEALREVGRRFVPFVN
ncbi:Proline dehydrogenase [Fusarium sp. Ph1]|nr:Proline dehydrogenase [Fusarium sp. Ph1]